MAPALAANEVEKALATSPSDGAENLQKLGLDYLATFKLLSTAVNEVGFERGNQGDGLFSVLFPWRLSRGEYLLRYLFVIVGVTLALAYPAFEKVRGTPMRSTILPVVGVILISIYKIGVLDAARFRDRGKTGFFAFIMILPVANLIAQVYLWFAR